jgi:hypothetical protein
LDRSIVRLRLCHPWTGRDDCDPLQSCALLPVDTAAIFKEADKILDRTSGAWELGQASVQQPSRTCKVE